MIGGFSVISARFSCSTLGGYYNDPLVFCTIFPAWFVWLQVPKRPELVDGPGMEDELAAILNAPPDPERPYVYRGTRCHINKFGILHPPALEKVIRCITGIRGAMLREQPIAGSFDLDHLRAIHRFLFQDVYEWAGEVRIIDFNRNEAPFTKADGFEEEAKRLTVMPGPPAQFSKAADVVRDCDRLFASLKREDFLRDLDRDAFVERGAHYLSALFLIHPFRDGNGRSTRTYFRQLAASAGWDLDLDGTAQIRRHLSAWQAHCGDTSALVEVFAGAVRGAYVSNGVVPSSATMSGTAVGGG